MIVFSKKVVTTWEKCSKSIKREETHLSVCVQTRKVCQLSQWLLLHGGIVGNLFFCIYMNIFITLLKTRGKLLTSKSVQAVPEWTNS